MLCFSMSLHHLIPTSNFIKIFSFTRALFDAFSIMMQQICPVSPRGVRSADMYSTLDGTESYYPPRPALPSDLPLHICLLFAAFPHGATRVDILF